MNHRLVNDCSDDESPIIQRKRRAIVLDSDDEADFVQPPVKNDVCNENVNCGNDAKQPGHVIEKAFIGLSISSASSSQSHNIDMIDDVTQRKLDFNAAVRLGKQHESNSNWAAALQSYHAAARLFPERNDLNKKLPTLQSKIDLQNAIESAKPIDEWFRGCSGVDEVFMSFIQPESAFDHPSSEPASASVLASTTFRMPLETHSALYQYQRRCLHWLWSLHCGGDGCGGILGDDMGLGKTVQISAFLCGLFHSKLIHSVLLVAPVSVLSGWERELGKWCEGIAVRSFHGTSAKSRNDALDTIRRQGGVLLTSYGLIGTSADVLHQAMAASPSGKFDYVILDEGHRIKNPSIQLSKRMREIAAAHRIVVTGTPMSNSLDELWALFDFACAGQLLGSHRDFKNQFEKPIVQSQDKYATDVERATGQVLSGRLQQLIAPFFLRRTKDEVLAVLKQAEQDDRQVDRPLQGDDDMQIVSQPAASSALLKLSEVQKNDLIVWCTLNDAQLELYRNFLELPEVRDLLNSTRSPLAALTVLKKICDHVLLCSNIKLVEHNFDIVTNDLSHLCNAPHRTASESEIDELLAGSSKLGIVLSLLLQLKQQHQRTLIFSQSKIMLNIIASIMRARHITFRRIDGDVVKPADRQQLISEFNNDDSIDCFLLTTQVGGLGISLTSATRVIIVDPHWNPSVDDQAVDRAFRIGQTRNVVVYRLITCGTVEEKIYCKQVFKSCLWQAALNQQKRTVKRYFSKSELKALFTLTNVDRSDTCDQMNRHQKKNNRYAELEQHIEWLLRSKASVYGVSDHDQLFAQTESAIELTDEMLAAVAAPSLMPNTASPRQRRRRRPVVPDSDSDTDTDQRAQADAYMSDPADDSESDREAEADHQAPHPIEPVDGSFVEFNAADPEQPEIAQPIQDQFEQYHDDDDEISNHVDDGGVIDLCDSPRARSPMRSSFSPPASQHFSPFLSPVSSVSCPAAASPEQQVEPGAQSVFESDESAPHCCQEHNDALKSVFGFDVRRCRCFASPRRVDRFNQALHDVENALGSGDGLAAFASATQALELIDDDVQVHAFVIEFAEQNAELLAAYEASAKGMI